MRRAQASTEFVVLAGLMIVFFLMMTVAVQSQIASARAVQTENRISQIYSLVNNELIVAKNVHQSYFRNFYLPASIDGRPYYLYFQDNNYALIIEHRGKNYTYFVDDNSSPIIPLEPGLNTIRKP